MEKKCAWLICATSRMILHVEACSQSWSCTVTLIHLITPSPDQLNFLYIPPRITQAHLYSTLTMAEVYSLVEDIEQETWNSINEAKRYIKYATAAEGTKLKWGTHKAGCLIYKCSYDVCTFRIVVTRTFEHGREVWRCRVDPAQHNDHEVGVPPKIICNRPACSQWVWQQVLSFHQISVRMVDQPDKPQLTDITINRLIDLQPVDPAG